MKIVQIGDRVRLAICDRWIGTIKQIYLTDHPFYVLWDDGKDDWYKGSALVLLENSK